MDFISQLSDELLLNLLSLLPTNEVVATMVLSKRWQFLWSMVPKLIYNDCFRNIQYGRFSRFVDRSLCLHEAPVIDTLHFKLVITGSVDNIRAWIRAAEKLNVRELIFELCACSTTPQASLPRSFYTGCKVLVKLNLSYGILVDVTSPFSFPSLKNLILLSMKYPGDEFFRRFLSKCPVLEELLLEQCQDDNLLICTIRVPSLKGLYLLKYSSGYGADGFVIDAPSLLRLEITDHTDGFCIIENEMPMIEKVEVDIKRSNIGNILGSVTSVKHLRLCLPTAKDPYPVRSVYHQLVSLKLCRCNDKWPNLLMRLLKDSPKLQSLTLDEAHDPRPCWTKPSAIPDCLLSSLETLEWEKYEGSEEEKEVVEYILRNGVCLKKVTISSESTNCDKKLEMIEVFTKSFRRSPTCQLVLKLSSFVYDLA